MTISSSNSVTLIGHYGGDEAHALSAWTSTSRDLPSDKRKRIPKLLKQLAQNGHGTPFEKSSLHFLVTTDIATHIQLLKHRIGTSINAESARYKEIKEDNLYIPEDMPQEWREALINYSQVGMGLYHECLEAMDQNKLMDRKRAKEIGRYFRTYNSQIQSDIMFNWRSFVHFQNLRNKSDAQMEIRELADLMLTLVKNIDGSPFAASIDAFGL